MAARRGDFEGALHMLLTFDVVEVGIVLRVLGKKLGEIDDGGGERLCPV